MISPEVKKTAYEIASDKSAFKAYFTADTDVPDGEYNRIKSALAMAIREELTTKQREYLTLYYGQNRTMAEIAETYGVNKSTVSRVIKRAQNKLKRVLKYASPRLQKPSAPIRHYNRKEE